MLSASIFVIFLQILILLFKKNDLYLYKFIYDSAGIAVVLKSNFKKWLAHSDIIVDSD